MKSRNAFAVLFVIEIILVILTYAFKWFSDSIGSFSYISQFILVLLLLIANLIIFIGLVDLKRWDYVAWFIYFSFVVVNAYAILVNNFALTWVTSVIAIGTLVLLVLDIILVLSDDSGEEKYGRHVAKQDVTIQYLQKENEMLQQKHEETKDRYSTQSGALRAQKNKLKSEMSEVSGALKAEKKKLKKELTEKEKELENARRKASRKESEARKADKKLKAALEKAKKTRMVRKKEVTHFVASKTGKTYHSPLCVSIQKVTKKDMRYFDTEAKAKKAKLKPCKVCSPSKKKNGKKFYVANKTANKVHKNTCILVDKIPRGKKVKFATERAALKKGFKPCKLCFPM